jgi:hypothetical protein
MSPDSNTRDIKVITIGIEKKTHLKAIEEALGPILLNVTKPPEITIEQAPVCINTPVKQKKIKNWQRKPY